MLNFHMDEMLPVWVNLLFIIVAQTILWIFLFSRLFQKSTNKTIQSLNGCIHLGHKMSPKNTELDKELVAVFQEIPPPTVACNWVPVRKLLVIIAVTFAFVALMITIASNSAKDRIWKLFLFSLLAYSLEIIFFQLIVLPYNHVDTEEIIYRVTDMKNNVR